MEYKVHHPVHNSPQLGTILHQTNPVHTTPSYCLNIRLNIIHPTMSLSSLWFLSFWRMVSSGMWRNIPEDTILHSHCHENHISFILVFQPLTYMESSSSYSCFMSCPSHPLDFTTLTILDKDYELWSSSLCSFHPPPGTSSLLGSTILFSTLVLFTDDTNTLLTDSEPISLNEKIQKVRKQLDNWFHANQLIINSKKTKALFFQGKRPNPIPRPAFRLNGKEVNYSSSVKFLGLYIAVNLCWATHTHHIC
jgi:hypothetical protein